jgi:hypothetical protein
MPVHCFQPGIEQRVALPKRSNRRFDIVRASCHARKLAQVRSKTVAPKAASINFGQFQFRWTRCRSGTKSAVVNLVIEAAARR